MVLRKRVSQYPKTSIGNISHGNDQKKNYVKKMTIDSWRKIKKEGRQYQEIINNYFKHTKDNIDKNRESGFLKKNQTKAP